MTISKVNAVGWAVGEKLTSAQANAFDTKIITALDGSGGGTYSPSGALILGGSGVHLSGANHKVLAAGALTVESGGTLTLAGTANYVILGSRQLTRSCPWSTALSTNFASGGGYTLVHSNTSAGTVSNFLPLPNGAQLNQVHVDVVGESSGVVGGITMPTLSVWKFNLATNVATQIGSTYTDPSASEAAFEALHTLSVTGLTETINRVTHAYYAVITAPTGGNTQSGFEISPMKVVFTTGVMDDGAS